MTTLCIFQIMGVPCCTNLQLEFDKKCLSRFFWCYDARAIIDANVLVIWGSLSKKLVPIVQDHVTLMPKTGHILHMRGCEERIHTDSASSSLAGVLPINSIFSGCSIKKSDYAGMLKEVRTCLRV